MASMRKEISDTWAQTLDLAKWKLATVGAVSVAGLGLGNLKPDIDTGILLLYSVGFLCTYIDLLIYRRLLLIHIIAGYLRKYDGNDVELRGEQAYEQEIERIRSSRKLFLSERWGHFLSSLVFSIGPVLLAIIKYSEGCHSRRLAIPALAVVMNVSLFVRFELGRSSLRKRCDLRLMSVDKPAGLVNEGRNLVIVALVGTNLHIRIFDANGTRVVNKTENELISGETLTTLKEQLDPLPDESDLSPEQKQKIIRDATSIAGHALRECTYYCWMKTGA